MAAATQVFDTTELLEMILYRLPTKDLLFAQRINKQAKAVIDTSTKLQQALFFTSIPGGPLSTLGLTTFKAARRDGIHTLKNPLLKTLFKTLKYFDSEGKGSVEDRIGCGDEDENEDDKFEYRNDIEHPSWGEANATWKRMLPCQPPIPRCFSVGLSTDRRERDLCIKDGVITMGSIIRHLDKVIDRHARYRHMVSLSPNYSFYSGEYLKSNHELEDLNDWLKNNSAHESDSEESEEDEEGEVDDEDEIGEEGEDQSEGKSEGEEESESDNSNYSYHESDYNSSEDERLLEDFRDDFFW